MKYSLYLEAVGSGDWNELIGRFLIGTVSRGL